MQDNIHLDFPIGTSTAEIIASQVLITIRHIIRPPIRSIVSCQGVPPSLVKTTRARDELVGVSRIEEIAVGGTAVEVAEVRDDRVVDGVVIQVSADTGAAAALVFEIGYSAVAVAMVHFVPPACDGVGPIEVALDVELGTVSQGAALFAGCFDVVWSDEIADEGVGGFAG